jgi:hypothetical protein
MIEPCPCNGCTERFIACSDHCPKDERGEYGYKAWQEQHKAQQKHLKDSGYRIDIPMSHAREKTSNHYIKHPLHKSGGNQ